MNDLELLRAYEPIAAYTKGEPFFPSAVDEYVKECSLWLTNPQGEDQLLVPHGELNVDHLADFAEIPSEHTMHLRFVDKPLEGLKYQRWLRDPHRDRFVAPGRLARVPLIFRLADLFFNLSFFVRGRVPWGHAAAAEVKYREIERLDPRRVYYGRVIRSGGWIALQYIFFFSMNSWRSGFFGINDHEADWEQVFVFLAEHEEGEPKPQWAAYASHDFKGDDLRRRWDDPLLVREGNHPVIFAGAGSHASYFEQGEYLMGVEPKFLRPLKRVLVRARELWYESLGMGSKTFVQDRNRSMLSVPFIDYARGDGRRIGPNQPEIWSPEIISDDIGWVNKYLGLWGLDTHDPFGGERAPAGPKYNRDGSVRQSWFDPIGWAGLDKVYPPVELAEKIEERLENVQAEIKVLQNENSVRRSELRKQALDVEALKVTEYSDNLRVKKEKELKQAHIDLQNLQSRETELIESQRALNSYARRVSRGDLGSPTAHLHHVHHPEPPLPPQHRVVEVWAALSGASILLGIVLLLIFRPEHWVIWLVGLGVIMGAVENLVRRNLVNYLLTIIIFLAVIDAFILLVEFWEWILALLLIGIVIFIIRGNLQELRR